jgi:hypothetical protein
LSSDHPAPTRTSSSLQSRESSPCLASTTASASSRCAAARRRPAATLSRSRSRIHPRPTLRLPASLTPVPFLPEHAQSDRPFYPKRDGPYSIPETAPTGETVWRNADEPTLATTPFAGCHTVYDVFEFAIARNGGRPAMGERAIEKSEMVDGFEKLTLSDYKWSTFTQVK